MTKRKSSKFSVCKKISLNYKNLWGTKKGMKLRATRVLVRKRKSSFYNKLIKTKQCFKNFYTNISEKKFKKRFKFCVKSSIKTLDKFVSFIERRIDIILYRVGFVSSLHEARQIINHGHVAVNSKKIYLISTEISKNDLVELVKKKQFFKKIIYNNIINFLFLRSTFSHLEVNYKLLSIILLWDPDVKSLFFPIKANYELVSRFYK